MIRNGNIVDPNPQHCRIRICNQQALCARSACEDGGHDDVLEELDGMAALAKEAASGDMLRLVGVLRAADVFWNPERVPVLCLMLGEEMVGDSPRILVRPHGR